MAASSNMNSFNQYDNSVAEFWKQRIMRDRDQHDTLKKMLNTDYDASSRASSSSTVTGTRDRSCTTGSDTGTVRSSEIFRLERQVDEERTRRLAIADELSVLKAQLTRACGAGTPS